MLALRCPFRINNSKQRSENLKGEQEMPSIKLCGNLLKNELMMVQGIQTVQGHHEERLEEMRDMQYRERITRRKMLNVLKETTCYKNSKCLVQG